MVTLYPRPLRREQDSVSKRQAALVAFIIPGIAGWVSGSILLTIFSNSPSLTELPRIFLGSLIIAPLIMAVSLAMPSLWLCWGACAAFSSTFLFGLGRGIRLISSVLLGVSVYFASGLDVQFIWSGAAVEASHPWPRPLFQASIALITTACAFGASLVVDRMQVQSLGTRPASGPSKE